MNRQLGHESCGCGSGMAHVNRNEILRGGPLASMFKELNSELAIIVGEAELLGGTFAERPDLSKRLEVIKAAAMKMAEKISPASTLPDRMRFPKTPSPRK